MMPVNHVQSRVCHVTVLADAGSLPRSESNRMLTAVDLTATGVIVNKQYLKVTYSPFKRAFTSEKHGTLALHYVPYLLTAYNNHVSKERDTKTPVFHSL